MFSKRNHVSCSMYMACRHNGKPDGIKDSDAPCDGSARGAKKNSYPLHTVRWYIATSLLFCCIGISSGQQQWERKGTIQLSELSTINSITYGSGKFVAVGAAGTIAVSADGGSTWTQYSDKSNGWFSGIIYGKGVFVAVGLEGIILTSTDAVTWIRQISGKTVDLRSIAFGNGIFVAGGDSGTVLTSSDGTNWKQCPTGSTDLFAKITYGNDLFVAVCLRNIINISDDKSAIRTSSDGNNWSERPESSQKQLYCIAFGKGRFVVPGWTGKSQTSSNGTGWTEIGIPETYAYDIIYADGFFVIVGTAISISSDNVNWTNVSSGTAAFSEFSGFIKCIAFGNGLFVAVGSSGMVFTSGAGSTRTYSRHSNCFNGNSDIEITSTGQYILARLPYTTVSCGVVDVNFFTVSGRLVSSAAGLLHEGHVSVPCPTISLGTCIISFTLNNETLRSKPIGLMR